LLLLICDAYYFTFLGLSCTSTCLSISTSCHCNWCMFSSWEGYWYTGRTDKKILYITDDKIWVCSSIFILLAV